MSESYLIIHDAQEERVGDMAHATHVLPYLLVARAFLAQRRASEVPAAMSYMTAHIRVCVHILPLIYVYALVVARALLAQRRSPEVPSSMSQITAHIRVCVPISPLIYVYANVYYHPYTFMRTYITTCIRLCVRTLPLVYVYAYVYHHAYTFMRSSWRAPSSPSAARLRCPQPCRI